MSLENFRHDQHCHIATNTIAGVGNPAELPSHGLLKQIVSVVELGRIRPAGKIRVAAMCEHSNVSDRYVVPWLSFYIRLRAMHVKLRMFA
jgi:hypothetical protein